MAKAKHYIPDGYHTVTPYMTFKSCAKALEFYKEAFGAIEIMRMGPPDGPIMHAEMKIGLSHIMMSDEFPGESSKSAETMGGSPIVMHLYVEDVDNFIARAISCGAKAGRPIADQFYGDRAGGISDPFGYSWFIATHKETLTPEEIRERAKSAH